MARERETPLQDAALQKCPSGISGLDEITRGGLPRGRPTLVCGGPGCGKSLMGIEFLVRGATQFGEPGVLMTFEETADDIRKNVASLGFDIDDLVKRKKLFLDYVRVAREEIEENGEYDLEGLFVRLNYAIRSVGARRVMLDTIEALFSGLANQGILRAELRRLFYWLKDKGMTTVITAERGEGNLTRQGLEEYVSDCVILLDHRVINQISTRRLRVVKYRGTTHGTNEYPFLIDEDGISVMPVTSMGLTHRASNERVSSGIPGLDQMLGGGLFRGSSVLVTGTAGTGKSSIAAHFADATCRRGERCQYFAFEESRDQIIRNMASIGLNLQPHVKKDLLHFYNARPTVHGLEMHLAIMHKQIAELKPSAVVIDPVSNFQNVGNRDDVHAMLLRLVDYLKMNRITALFTNLTGADQAKESTDAAISSIMDTWILMRDIELGGERNRGLYVLKSRGMNHSNQIREFRITPRGVRLLDVYVGPEGVLTGSARLAQEAREAAAAAAREQDLQAKQLELDRMRRAMESRIEVLRAEFEAEENRVMRDIRLAQDREAMVAQDRVAMRQVRNGEEQKSAATEPNGDEVNLKQRNSPRRGRK
jgi:circadian clock protein KaiC